MANRRFIDFPIASSVGDSDIILIWQSGANKQTTKATFLSGLPENLDELNDVAISGLTNGQILRYDSVTGKWENTDQGNLDLNDLNDVSIVSPSNGQVLVYNSSTSKWENSSGGYVPYTGAVTTVNLGAQTIQAGSFVKAGGTAAQFLKADGSVDSNVYGTGTVTSVALTMPTAFSVANSPITTAGTLAVTGAGTVGQYIRGDGSLADFPESSGGGSSVSYYLNGSVNQGTIGGVAYKELNKVPVLGAGTDFTINADGYIASFITDAGDPNLLEIPGGNWNFETYFSASSSGGTPSFYVELYKVNSGGTATLIASNSGFPELIAFGTNIISYFSTLAVPTTALALTDRLAIRYYVTHSGRTITLHTEDNHLCQIITTFTTGITALNGLTAQVQNFAVGTSGTDFAIASATATHTFNLPTASATNRGALSSADWTTFNNKTSNLGTVTSVGLSSATSGVTIGSTPVTTSGTITLAIATASGSQNGLLSSTDWTTFNSKQPAGNYVTLDTTQTITGQKTISRAAANFNGTVQSLLIDGDNSQAAITLNSVATGYAYQTFSQNGVGKFEIGIIGTGGNGSFYINKTIQNGESGASIFIKKSDGFVGINNITPTFQLDVTGKIYSSTEIQANTAVINTTGGYATFGSNTASAPIRIGRNASSNDIIVAASGNVLIGTTTDLGFKLRVEGTSRFTNLMSIDAGAFGSEALTLNSSTNQQYIAINSATGFEAMTKYFNPTAGNWYTGIRASAGLGSTSSYHIYSSTYGADVFVFNTDGSSRFVGSVGIGVAPATNLHVQGGSVSYGQVRITSTSGSGGEASINYGRTDQTVDNRWTVGQGVASIADSFGFYTGGSVRLMVTTGGNVLIGKTTDNGARLQVAATSAIVTVTSTTGTSFNGIELQNSGGSFYVGQDNSAGNFYGSGTAYAACFYTSQNRDFVFFNGANERMRITSVGDVYFGNSTVSVANTALFFTKSNGNIIQVFSHSSGTVTIQEYYKQGSGLTGSITYNGTNTLYNATSDYRLKEDLKDYNALQILGKLKTYDFKWKNTNTRDFGMLAHELQEVLPNYVSGQKDELTDDKSVKPQVVDYSKIVPLLIKSIQELKQEIDTLKN